MVKMLMRVHVQDYAKWKTGYDAAEGIRKASGALSSTVYPEVGNPNVVVVITEWDSADKAKAFAQSPALKEAQSKAGVIGKPEVFILQSL